MRGKTVMKTIYKKNKQEEVRGGESVLLVVVGGGGCAAGGGGSGKSCYSVSAMVKLRQTCQIF